MTEIHLRPKYTQCSSPLGQQARPGRPGISRHSLMIKELGKCRFCDSNCLYRGLREEMLEKISDDFLSTYVTRDESDAERVWGIEDGFFAWMLALGDDELDSHWEDKGLDVDYDAEGLRVIHEALMRAAGKIEAHLNSAGEDL